MADSFWELYKRPEWQRKRLEILNRDNWMCQECESTEKTLHIHHAYYERGFAPWDYPEESLSTLCEDCHKAAQELRTTLMRQLGRLTPINDLRRLIGYATSIEAWVYPMVPIDVHDPDTLKGVTDLWQVREMDVIDILMKNEKRITGWQLFALKKGAPPDEALNVDGFYRPSKE